MKHKKLIIVAFIFVAILIITAIFAIATYIVHINTNKNTIIGEEIPMPDRIVYRDKDGNYFEFFNGEEDYHKIIELIGSSIDSYDTNGELLDDTEIDEIHTKSLLEFDYETISKNYIIQLEDNDNKAIIKLGDTGGTICTKKIKNLNRINKTLDNLVKEKEAYSLEYEEYFSKNSLQTLEYKYTQLFKMINYKIYQTTIDNYEDYEKFYAICNLALDEKIDENTFQDNVVVLTVSQVPKITVKVNIGNIKYTYDSVENADYQYVAHVLVVSKIVNTDCIYNTDLTEISADVLLDNLKTEYNESVENLNSNIFVTDFEQFYEEYENTDTSISEEKAKEIAEYGFKEAERICGEYDSNTQIVNEESVKPNNFFTRKTGEYDYTYPQNVDVYSFSRTDDMQLNGVKVYVDKKLGKIVGGGAFGD